MGVGENAFLMRDGHAEPCDLERFNGRDEVRELAHMKRHVHSIILAGREGGIVDEPREGVGNRSADYPKNTEWWIDFLGQISKTTSEAVDALEVARWNLTGSSAM